ncbi:hypothetical protein [Roseibium sp. Sym1]|uniref:hypothetical protein n=1 Tax=Roseibium sp. Sym1 TaxID=3016006 RepID=UPI0022B3AB28|nr:hypothetical protein [Roseibium sp. Sym1]
MSKTKTDVVEVVETGDRKVVNRFVDGLCWKAWQSEGDFRRWLENEHAKARNQALEEAAKAAEDHGITLPLAVGIVDGASIALNQITAAIRALKT